MRPYLVALAERSSPRAPLLRLVDLPPAVPEVGDGELVRLCRSGDLGAFEQLYRRHAARAMALAVRIQGHRHDVEDIVHDAFVRVHDHLHTLENGDAFRPWLGSIVVRLVRSRLRRRSFLGRLGFGGGDDVDVEAVLDPGASPEQKFELSEVYAVLRTLDVEPRIAWVLRYIEGHKLEDVAELTHASLATVKRRLVLAQEALAGGVA
jgi:RNA polymerase sigma-70 factor, ECF subfamily